jgi:hypothetical protein
LLTCTATDSGTTYHPMLFNCEDPFGELFSCCILFLNKTWKEMSAALVDFNKVCRYMYQLFINYYVHGDNRSKSSMSRRQVWNDPVHYVTGV